MTESSSPRTAFVLAGGGSLGAVQVGMLKALARRGVIPDLVVGASVGAINGVYFARNPTQEGVARLERVWKRLTRDSIFPFSLVTCLLGFVGMRDHLVKPAGIRSVLVKEFGGRHLEQMPMPCHVIATDVLSGAEVVLSSGPVLPALLASAAIPTIFPAVPIDDRSLMDGGVTNNTPISTAVRLGAKRIVVLPTGMPCALSTPPRAAIAVGLHALNLMAMERLQSDMDRFRSQVELVIVPPLCPLGTSPYDFSQTSELIHRADAMTRLWLRKRGMESGDAPPEMLVHHHDAADYSSDPIDALPG